MENRINIAELLKDCPTGMELDCVMYEDCRFLDVDTKGNSYLIRITTPCGIKYLDKYGCYTTDNKAKCIIFPKGKTTWEGFYRPYINGDVIVDKYGAIAIYKQVYNSHDEYLVDFHCGLTSKNRCLYIKDRDSLQHCGEISSIRFATEEEKAELFKAIKDNGYKWNPETKTLEKVDEPKFHEGDWIIRNNKYTGIPVKVIGFNDYYSCELNGEVVNLTRNDVHNNFHLWTIDDAKDGDVLAINWHEGDDSWEKIIIFKKYHNNGVEGLINSPCVEGYGNTFKNGKLVFHEEVPYFSKTWTDSLYPATKEQCKLLFQKIREAGYKWNAEIKTLEKLVEPIFKVGDRIRHKEETTWTCVIKRIDDRYWVYGHPTCYTIPFGEQDEYELVPNKFDINTLKPLQPVLVRNTNGQVWTLDFFSHKIDTNKGLKPSLVCVGHCPNQCIPYKGNEFLRGTSDDCKDFYKTWE